MLEILIITVLVLWSCLVVFKKIMPNTAQQLFTGLANFCQRQGWQALAAYLMPKKNTGCGGGCDCGSASTMQSSKQPVEVKTVKWK